MPGCVVIPEWGGKILRQMTGPKELRTHWYIYDPKTNVNTRYIPPGEAPYERYIGSKMFYYPARQAVIYLSSKAVYVMRVGED